MMRVHIWCSTEDGPRCATCNVPKTPATANMFCSGVPEVPDVPPPAEEADPAWLTWHPAPLTPEQRFVLAQLGDGAVFQMHDQTRDTDTRPLAHVQWAIQHEYVRYDGRSRHNPHVLRFIISEAGRAALATQAARQGEG